MPASVVKQRYRDQILYDVAQRPDSATGRRLRCKERNLQPVATPDIRDVVIEEGRPLTFVADFETLPPIEPGEYIGLTLRKPPAVLEVGAVDRALAELQQRAARWHPVEDRPAAAGDTLLMDLTRTRRTSVIEMPGERRPAPGGADDKPETLQNVSIELGADANPPGFDEHLVGHVGRRRARRSRSTIRRDYDSAGAGRRDRRLRRDSQGRAPQGNAAARRRVREGSERRWRRSTRCETASGRTCSAAPSTRPSIGCATSC